MLARIKHTLKLRKTERGNQVLPFDGRPAPAATPVPEPTPAPIPEDKPLDSLLAKFVWQTFRGRIFVPDPGYGHDLMIMLEEHGLKKPKGNSVTPMDDRSFGAAQAVQAAARVGNVVRQTNNARASEFAMANDSELAAAGFDDTLQGQMSALAVDLGLGTTPVIAQLSALVHLVIEVYALSDVRSAINKVSQTHDALLQSAVRKLGVQGLLTNLESKRDNHKLQIGKYSIDMAVTFVPGGSAIRAGVRLGEFALKAAHAAKLHDVVERVNAVLLTDSEDPPAAFNLTLFEDFPLLSNYLFLYPGTSAMLGISPLDADPMDAEIGQMDITLDQLRKNGVSLQAQHKAYAENIKKHARERVCAAPYVLRQRNGELPPWHNKLRRAGGKFAVTK